MANSLERAKQLYLQCQNAYEQYISSPHAKSILQDGDENIDMPNHFYDAYNVPAELLYSELYDSKGGKAERIIFDRNLLLMLHKKQGFSKAQLQCKPQVKDRRLRKRFEVYFEVYYRQSGFAPLLFKKQMTIGGTTYKWCSKQTFRRQVRAMEASEGAHSGLYKRRRGERFSTNSSLYEKDQRPIKASLLAFNELEAANQILSGFDNFVSCVNVAQTIGSQSFTVFSDSPRTKPKSVIVSVAVMLVKAPSKDVDILWDTSRQILPKTTMTLTEQPSKMKMLKKLVKACDDSTPAAKRLKFVTQELSQAIDTDNPNLRQLGLWRCLEIATAKSNQSRKESDVIKIFQNYYPKAEHWHQMGELVKNLRNRYVHQGVNSDNNELNDYHLNWSQQYAECALRVLLYVYEHRAVWKTEADIDVFFDCYAQSDSSLMLAGKFLTERTNSRKVK
ncbi:hypothetical protein BH23PAT2_BH23PAT2_10150 [soil metagenome]